jgi:hypothetical protein
MKNPVQFWLRSTLFNLLVVALLGSLMRYKIAFEFPFFDQQNILHAHSHFAFSGWVSQILMVLMIHYLWQRKLTAAFENYRLLLWANLVCSYAMLVSFFVSGYSPVSLTFSTTSVLISYLFTYVFFKDLKEIPDGDPSKPWFKAALAFQVFSTVGTFALAYMMASHQLVQRFYLGSIYFYLHFQYNGWFFFACFGLFLGHLHLRFPEIKVPGKIFSLFSVSCVLAYFLSTLWADLPVWLYSVTVAAAFMQVIAWYLFLKFYNQYKAEILSTLSPFWHWFFALLLIAVTAKLLLQLGSTIPEVSRLAFGFRPIVIAYLHLILLAIVSVFLIVFVFSSELLPSGKRVRTGLVVFISGVYLNELVLGIQGIASFSYTPVPYANEILFFLALWMVLGLILGLVSLPKSR